MIKNVNELKPLSHREIALVRDIFVPINVTESKRYSLDIASAVAFTGEPAARRLLDTSNEELIRHSAQMAEQIEKAVSKGLSRFRVEVEGYCYRAQLGRNASSLDLQLRSIPSEVPLLEQLQMPALWRSLMLSDALFDGGLVLIAAPQGQGKTTTASSMVATRLTRFAGLANTLEEPIELPLQGVWGSGGLCIQRPVETSHGPGSNGRGFGSAMLDSLRQFPAISGGSTMLFIGEIMDGTTATEAMKAAANGHLVIATIHGKGIEAALRRFILMAASAQNSVNESSLRGLLGSVLRGVFQQHLSWTLGGQGWSAASISGSLLWSQTTSSGVAAALRSSDHKALFSEIERQARLQSENPDGFLEAVQHEQAQVA